MKCSPTNLPSGPATGANTRKPDNSWSTATSTSPKTGSEPENASTPGNAEAPESAKDRDGATVMTPARRSTNEMPQTILVQPLTREQ